MGQFDILNFMKQKNRPIRRDELFSININKRSLDRHLCQLKKYGFITSSPHKPGKRISTYYYLK